MSVTDGLEGHKLIVADDGSIPAEQVTRLGLAPGTRLRVVAEQPPETSGSIAGRLTSWPELSWDDFVQASRFAQADLGRR